MLYSYMHFLVANICNSFIMSDLPHQVEPHAKAEVACTAWPFWLHALCILHCAMRAFHFYSLAVEGVSIAMKHFHPIILVCAALAAKSFAADTQNVSVNCTNNFTVLENALLETNDNIFQLTTTYFPPDEENPLYVDVYYTFCDSSNKTHYIWSAATLYFIVRQPALAYLSQFYSHIRDPRIAVLTLTLPADCAELVKDTSSRKENLLFVLTQRVNNKAHVFSLCEGC